jgi:predicted amidohydrolase
MRSMGWRFAVPLAVIVAALLSVGALESRGQTPPHAPGSVASSQKHQVIRVGIIQMNARLYDTAYNLQQAEEGIKQAAAQGAKIVVTPEAAVQGYPRIGLSRGESLNDPKIVAGREKILASAEKIPGPATERFSQLARQLGIWIIFGMDENRDGKMFNTAVLMNPQGKITGTFSKVHLQNWMLVSGVHHGDDFPVWSVEINGVPVKLGIEICYDVQHPESTLELALGGAEVVFIPYCALGMARPRQIHLYETTALENKLYIVRATYGAPRSNGVSAIINYEGEMAQQLGDQPGVLVGDIDLTALRNARAESNPVYGLPNRYPSAYKRLRDCSVNTSSPARQK